MNVVETVSMSWSCASLTYGTVCSRTLLTRPSTSGESNWEHACMQMDNILNIYCECVWLDKNYGQIHQKDVLLLLNLWTWVLKFPKVRYNKQVRWYFKPPFDGIFTQQYFCQKLLESDNYCWNYRWWLGGILFLRHSVEASNLAWRLVIGSPNQRMTNRTWKGVVTLHEPF